MSARLGPGGYVSGYVSAATAPAPGRPRPAASSRRRARSGAGNSSPCVCESRRRPRRAAAPRSECAAPAPGNASSSAGGGGASSCVCESTGTARSGEARRVRRRALRRELVLRLRVDVVEAELDLIRGHARRGRGEVRGRRRRHRDGSKAGDSSIRRSRCRPSKNSTSVKKRQTVRLGEAPVVALPAAAAAEVADVRAGFTRNIERLLHRAPHARRRVRASFMAVASLFVSAITTNKGMSSPRDSRRRPRASAAWRLNGRRASPLANSPYVY